MDTLKLFTVTVSDRKLAADRVRLRVPRTEEQIDSLKRRYERVEAVEYGHTEGQSEFVTALTALSRLYAYCNRVGNDELGLRAQSAFVALMGKQMCLESTSGNEVRDVSGVRPIPERDPFPDETMNGLGAWR